MDRCITRSMTSVDRSIISTLGTNRLGTKRPWVRNVPIPLWIGKWMDRWIARSMDLWIARSMDLWIARSMDCWIARSMDPAI